LIKEYYNKRLKGQFSFEDTLDEINSAVDHVEPWMSGNARGPSTAFCLLFHLFTLNLQSIQIKILLDHSGSPYVRALGFLYLSPREIWQWFEPFMKTNEKFNPSPLGTSGMKEVTIGEFVRDIVLTHSYFETLLPRFPEPLKRTWMKNLDNIGLPIKSVGNGGQGGVDRRGINEPNKRPASVKASLSVGFKQRAPNRKNACELSVGFIRRENSDFVKNNNSVNSDRRKFRRGPSRDSFKSIRCYCEEGVNICSFYAKSWFTD